MEWSGVRQREFESVPLQLHAQQQQQQQLHAQQQPWIGPAGPFRPMYEPATISVEKPKNTQQPIQWLMPQFSGYGASRALPTEFISRPFHETK
jgi:hypothetical protein